MGFYSIDLAGDKFFISGQIDHFLVHLAGNKFSINGQINVFFNRFGHK